MAAPSLNEPDSIIWKPHAGPQTKALASPALELLFGGSAGGGKSAWLVAGPLRYVANPSFRGILFRNSYKEILKISDQEARPVYEPLGAKFNKGEMIWEFPTGAMVYLSYLERDEQAYAHQGAQYQYCGFDELTHFSQFQYRYLFSRLRGKHGIPIEMRATCNPEPGWVKERWAPWVDEKYEGQRALSGKILYYVTDEQGIEHYVPRGTPDALSRSFVRSSLADNPSLAGTAYEAQLKSLDPVQRARLLNGDWGADYTPGLLFRRGMFRLVGAVPEQAIRVRAWDLAATEEKLAGARAFRPESKNDPDWSVGLLYGWAPNFGFFVEAIERVRGRPEEIRKTIERITNQDAARYGRGAVVTTLPQDPGQAGKAQAAAYADMLSAHRVMLRIPSGSKVVRAGAASATAENSGIAVLQGPWNELFFQEAEQFPKGQFDDQIDALSDGHNTIAELRGTQIAEESAGWDNLPDLS